MSTSSVTHYERLGLPNHPNLTASDVKEAYRRTLLVQHPDKSKQRPTSSTYSSIDQISTAYKTLIDSDKKTAYDQTLRKHADTHTDVPSDVGHACIESYDLDDLKHTLNKEGKGIWFKTCQCGNRNGYTITEQELERAVNNIAASTEVQEVLLGCEGCSLVIRVVFNVF